MYKVFNKIIFFFNFSFKSESVVEIELFWLRYNKFMILLCSEFENILCVKKYAPNIKNVINKIVLFLEVTQLQEKLAYWLQRYKML